MVYRLNLTLYKSNSPYMIKNLRPLSPPRLRLYESQKTQYVTLPINSNYLNPVEMSLGINTMTHDITVKHSSGSFN